MRFARPLFFLMALTLASVVARADEKPFTDAKKAEIGEIVKSYLMSHPELIQEALNELDKKQRDVEAQAQKTAVTSLHPDLIKAENGVVLGNPSGDVTLVEFFDYNCGYCKKAMADIMGLMKADPKLRVVLRDFPVLGPDSVEASKVALAVRSQLSSAKYVEFHQKLIETRGRVGKDRAIEVAQSLGADPAKIEKDLDSAEIKKLLGGTMRAADQLRIGGTPAFVVADGVIVGAVGQEALADTIKAARTCGKSVC
ncbi:MAG: DsbA family protein [Hyphomicrobiales bacterium]